MKISHKEFSNKITILTNKLNNGYLNEVINDGLLLLKKVNQPILYNILSSAFQAKGDFENSIKIIEEGLKIDPHNIYFLNNIGLTYYKKNDLIKAEEYFNRAINIDPDFINVLNNLACIKTDLNLVDEAIELLQKSLSLNKNVLQTNYNLASIFQSIGNFEKSIEYFKQTLEINPRFTKADRNIALMSNYNKENKHFIEMKNKLSKLDLNNTELHELHFALGKAHEDVKNHNEAFNNFEKANDYKKKTTNYKIETDIKEFQEIKEKFANKLNIKKKFNKKKLIFILGMPRSGTSLIEQIISSHSDVYGGGELVYLTDIIFKIFSDKNIFFDTKNLENKSKILQDEYLKKICLIDNSDKCFTDKTPLNFKWIGFIINFFPNSKIIHCKRNSLDNCWSIFKNNFDGNLNFSNNLSDLGKYYKLYEDLMLFWKKKYPNQIYDLVYEDMTSDHENEIKKVLKFCNLPWDNNCLKHYENKKSIKTVSFLQARKPIYRSSVNSSEVYLEYLAKLKSILR